jgi:hypothetical protein
MTPRERLTSDPPRRTPTPSSSLRTFSRLWWGAPRRVIVPVPTRASVSGSSRAFESRAELTRASTHTHCIRSYCTDRKGRVEVPSRCETIRCR